MKSKNEYYVKISIERYDELIEIEKGLKESICFTISREGYHDSDGTWRSKQFYNFLYKDKAIASLKKEIEAKDKLIESKNFEVSVLKMELKEEKKSKSFWG